MSRGTSYNAIREAIEAGERLTRTQCRSLLEHSQSQERRIDAYARRIADLERALHYSQVGLEHEQEYYSTLAKKWNGLMEVMRARIKKSSTDKPWKRSFLSFPNRRILVPNRLDKVLYSCYNDISE